MQLKYNRGESLGGSLIRILIKLILILVVIIVGIFLIEKIKFPSPEKNYKIDITNEIKKLK
jgi:flagellar biogenesis protein FliO